MKAPKISKAEEARLHADAKREQPEILRAVREMAEILGRLSPTGQKLALGQLVASWIVAVYPDDKSMALLLSDAVREQVDINLDEVMRQRHSSQN